MNKRIIVLLLIAFATIYIVQKEQITDSLKFRTWRESMLQVVENVEPTSKPEKQQQLLAPYPPPLPYPYPAPDDNLPTQTPRPTPSPRPPIPTWASTIVVTQSP